MRNSFGCGPLLPQVYQKLFAEKWNPSSAIGNREDWISLVGLTEGGDMPLLNEANITRQLEFSKDAFCRVNLPDGIYKPHNYGRIRLIEEVEVKDGRFLNNLIMEGRFKWVQETVQSEIEAGTLFYIKSDKFSIRYERNEKKRVKVPSNLITQKECQVGTNEEANTELVVCHI